MSIQRLNRVPVVILTGVENAGKTTLSEGLAAALQWDLIPEAARTDKRVLEGNADQTYRFRFNLNLNLIWIWIQIWI